MEGSVEMTSAQQQQGQAEYQAVPTTATTATANTQQQAHAPLEELEQDEADSNKCSERTLWTRFWQGFAVASVVINIIAMAVEGSAVMIVAGVVAAAVGFGVTVRQFELENTDSLREVQNALRREVNRLQVENNKLSSEITKLETQVGRLQEQEEKLDNITKKQGTNVDTFVGLVKENREIIDELKICVRADTMQQLVTVIIDSDFDESATFSDQEIGILELRMKNVPGVKVDHEKLTQCVSASDRRLESVLALLMSDIGSDDLPEEERIFLINEEEVVEKQLVQ